MRGRATAAILVGATLLGFSAIFVKWAVVGGATALTVGFYRMAVALPGAWLLARRAGSLGGARGRAWALAAGAAFFLDLALWHLAMHETSAANATLLVGGLSPLWVALFAFFALGRRVGPLGWLGQLAGFAGALVLALARGAHGAVAAGAVGTGEAVAVGASFAYAAFTLMMTRARATLAAPQALFWMSLACLACFAVAAVAAGHPFTGYDARAWASLVGLGLVVQLAAWWLNSWGLGHVEPTVSALALQMQQVATLFLAAWLLAEPLRPLGLVGGALLCGGIVLVSLDARRGRAA
ncbi:MAG TPA: DMT family transporter [Polyangia bacterium]|nr:DMT family transporter [Polyangia bacterium]